MKTLIDERYGGLRPLARWYGWSLAAAIGALSETKRIAPGSVERLIFVCSGNICRSPFAEYLAAKAGIEAASAGLHAARGDPANPRALTVAPQFGVDLSTHRSKPMADVPARAGDLFVFFEPKHLQEFRQLPDFKTAPATVLGMWLAGPRPYIHDPYGLSEKHFAHCYERIRAGVNALRERLNVASR